MTDFMKADIFFFIASAASVIVTVLVSIALFYFIKAGKNFYSLSQEIQNHIKDSEEFIAELKDRLENNFFFRLLFPLGKKTKRSKTKSGTIHKRVE